MLLAACGEPVEPAPDAREVTDVRVPIPTPDPAYLDLISPELEIAPGQSAIYCLYKDNPLGRFGTDHVNATQGDGGHHVAFRHATTKRPDGTFEDCTEDQEALQLGDLFVGNNLPAGWASEVPADTQFVLEMHYLNATDLPMLARDVIRIHRLPDAQITKWVHPMHLKTYDIAVPPGASSLAFECTVPHAVALYEHWGHQHELGMTFTVEMMPPAQTASTLYNVVWGVDGTVHGNNTTPIALAAGTRLRITCEWRNPTGRMIVFPEEMCAFGGIVEGGELSCAPSSFVP